ncbi:MAG: hypothetical protein OER56_04930 [Hyphomicrobiales bacterium]|nr:hypothetical protein [Hyphomicrobiales bacterium]
MDDCSRISRPGNLGAYPHPVRLVTDCTSPDARFDYIPIIDVAESPPRAKRCRLATVFNRPQGLATTP